MSDWEVVTDNEEPMQNNRRNYNSDWEVEGPQKNESYLSKLPRNVVTGLANRGHSLLNTPHDLAQGFENSSKAFGSMFNNAFAFPPEVQQRINETKSKNPFKLSEHIPYQQEYDFAKMLGQEGEPTWADYMTQKGVEFLPEIALGANALKNVLPHLTKRGASKTLSQAKQLAANRNIAPLDVNPELIDDAAQFLPKTSAYKNAMEAAKHGDYNALFKLQSDLGKHSSDYAKSLFSASERAHGRAGMSLRNQLLNEIHEGLQSQGHGDISDLLRQGQNEYRRYMKIKPYRNALAVAAGAYAIPKNTLIDLAKKMVFMNKD